MTLVPVSFLEKHNRTSIWFGPDLLWVKSRRWDKRLGLAHMLMLFTFPEAFNVTYSNISSSGCSPKHVDVFKRYRYGTAVSLCIQLKQARCYLAVYPFFGLSSLLRRENNAQRAHLSPSRGRMSVPHVWPTPLHLSARYRTDRSTLCRPPGAGERAAARLCVHP